MLPTASQRLAELYPEVPPLDYYADLLPSELMEPQGQHVQGAYCAIAVTLSEDGKARRTQITQGLSELPALIASNEFSMMAPMLFAGRKASNANARYLTALEFDLDFLRVKGDRLFGMDALLQQTSLVGTDAYDRLPKPTYIIASSARNLHLVYLLDKPLPMYPNVLDSVRDYRRALIPKIWDSWICECYKKPQFETSPVQAFRLVGSRSKHKDDAVRAYRTGDRVTVEYLNKYSPNKLVDCRHSMSLAEAKELYPDWYEARITKGLPRRAWECHEGLYDWWLSRMPEVQVGHRYHYMVCLASYAQKCGIDEDRLAQDMAMCRAEMDKLSPPDNTLTMADMGKALQAHQERYRTLPRRKISELSGLEIKQAKRNGRTRAVHLKRARAVQAIDYPEGEWRNVCGAPTKKELVRQYVASHPYETVTQIAKGLGISRTTVYKWLEELEQERYSQNKPKDGTPPDAPRC